MKYIVVINTFNRKTEIVERALLSALKQKFTPQKVILIDQNLVELILKEEITNNLLFCRQKTNHKAVSSARNSLVIPEAIDWIVFCDDDGYLNDDYSVTLKNIIQDNPSIEIVAGSIKREDTNDFYSLRHKKGGSLKHFRNTKNLMGSNFAVKAEIFNKLNRFDENFGVGSYWGSSEETDFCWKAFFNNVNMEFFSELFIFHAPPFNEEFFNGFKKAFKYGVGKGGLVWKWLIKEKKIIVFYELVEMLIVPFIQIIRGIFTLKPALAINNVATISGRVYGLIKALFKN